MNTVYNRYIPQSDGSYQRNRVQDPKRQGPQDHGKQTPPPPPPPVCPPPVPQSNHSHSTTGFLKQLLPKEFDTGDLLIVLLLLLIGGDCEEEKSNALLTLALYFLL